MTYYVDSPARRRGKSEFSRLAMQLALECGCTVYCPAPDGANGYSVRRVKVTPHRYLDVYSNLSPLLNKVFLLGDRR